MAQQTFIEVPLDCSADAFYKFFTEEAGKLPTVCGSIVTNVELADGNQSWVDVVGSRKWIYFKAPTDSINSIEKIKDEVVSKEDPFRKIIFSVVEGRILAIYRFLRVTLELTDDNKAKWTIDYEQRIAGSQGPDAYLSHLRYVSKAVEAYLKHIAHSSG